MIDERRPWTWWERVAYWLYGFFLGPFLTKHQDGTITGAMTRWAVAWFTFAMVYRLVQTSQVPLGWADAFAMFFILFALPIDGAMTTLARRNPEKLVSAVTGMLRGTDDGMDRTASVVVSESSTPSSEHPSDGALG